MQTGPIKGSVLENRLLLLLRSICEHTQAGGFNIGKRDHAVDIGLIYAETLSFLEQAVKEKIEREENSPDPDPPRDRSKPFPEPRCEHCTHYKAKDKVSGHCLNLNDAIVRPVHRCSHFLRRIKPICRNCDFYQSLDKDRGHCLKSYKKMGMLPTPEKVIAEHSCRYYQHTVPESDIQLETEYKCKHCVRFKRNRFFDHGCPLGSRGSDWVICHEFKKAEFCKDCEYYSDYECLNFDKQVNPDDCFGCFKPKKSDPPSPCLNCEHDFKPRPPTPEPLRLCPFCGSSEVVVETTNRKMENRGHRVFCAACGSRGPERTTKAGAIAIWNSRPGDDS